MGKAGLAACSKNESISSLSPSTAGGDNKQGGMIVPLLFSGGSTQGAARTAQPVPSAGSESFSQGLSWGCPLWGCSRGQGQGTPCRAGAPKASLGSTVLSRQGTGEHLSVLGNATAAFHCVPYTEEMESRK